MYTNNNNTKSFSELAAHEWLVTNGIGGFASSSIIGANTRRYHGLLTAALHPPADRWVLVAKVEESIVFSRDGAYSISSNQFPGNVHPHGHQFFQFFERKPLPRFKFEADGNHILKTVFMAHGSNTTVVEYQNTGERAFQLRLNPMFVHRDYHGLYREDASHDFWCKRDEGRCAVYAYFGAQPVFWAFSKGEFREERFWFKNLQYAREQERGLDFEEDYCSIGHVTTVLKPGESVFLTFSTDEKMVQQDPEALKRKELDRLESLVQGVANHPFLSDLMVAGDQFLVKRGDDAYTLIAGYPWFTDWGRDTMIAMRGLTIATGKQAISKSILETFLRHVNGGMLPNRFPDQGETPEYNTIDATLWLFVALYEYYQKFHDIEFIERCFGQLTDIMEHHLSGTRFNIKATEEGFLSGGEGLAQLTWMDARIGDYVVTPRHGCPVEIQALWYNALRIYQYFAGTLQQPYERFAAVAERLFQNFPKYFVRQGGGLNDVVTWQKGTFVADPSIRPNQIYAVSLPFSLLSAEQEKAVLQEVKEHLLTDFGLRTRAPEHPDFRPVYNGGPWERDTAYHQGTVWPFLLGEYITAYMKVNNWSEAALKESQNLLNPLKKHFYQHDCAFGISEIFDGKIPRGGKGAVHQAWSVGAVLKTLIDLDIRHKKQKKPVILPFTQISSFFF